MNTYTEGRCLNVSRRSFLLALAGATGGLFFASNQRFVIAEPESRSWSAWLLDTYNRASVQRLGEAYLADHPQENSADVLADLIDRALTHAGVPGTAADLDAHADVLKKRVRDEYASNEVVRLSGWILSISEVRLYALVSLDSVSPDGS